MMPKLEIKKHVLPWVDQTKKIQPTCIVLHWWGEQITNRGIERLHEVLESRQLSVQFAVLANESIYQLVPRADTLCYHAKCANRSSIGIEIEGLGRDDLDSNQAQFDVVVQLVQKLKSEYDIGNDFSLVQEADGLRFFGVASHKQVDEHCSGASGKVDVHDEYVERVKAALEPAHLYTKNQGS